MEFEQALVVELSMIEGLKSNIFPLYAPEGEEPPFLIYASSEGSLTQTLLGFTIEKIVEFDIHIITKSYTSMKTLTKAVIEHINTFNGRAIGNGGPFIKSISYEQPREEHESDIGYYRSSIDYRVRI